MDLDESPTARTFDHQALALPACHQLPAVAPDVHAGSGRRAGFTHGSTLLTRDMSRWRHRERSDLIHEE